MFFCHLARVTGLFAFVLFGPSFTGAAQTPTGQTPRPAQDGQTAVCHTPEEHSGMFSMLITRQVAPPATIDRMLTTSWLNQRTLSPLPSIDHVMRDFFSALLSPLGAGEPAKDMTLMAQQTASEDDSNATCDRFGLNGKKWRCHCRKCKKGGAEDPSCRRWCKKSLCFCKPQPCDLPT